MSAAHELRLLPLIVRSSDIPSRPRPSDFLVALSAREVEIVRRGYVDSVLCQVAGSGGAVSAYIETDDFLDAEDRVIVLGRLIEHVADGLESITPVLHIWTVEGDRAVLVAHYAVEATGALRPA